MTIGVLALIVNGLAGVTTIWDPQSWPLLLGLLLVAFAPFAVFGLFSFVGATAVDSLGSRVGSNAVRTSTSAGRSLARIPSRLGSSPAGSRTAGRASTTVGAPALASTARNDLPTGRTDTLATSRRPAGATAPSTASLSPQPVAAPPPLQTPSSAPPRDAASPASAPTRRTP